MALVLFVVGLVFLIIGAEALVRGASRMAGAMGISPLVIGLTVVAFGTSSPELAVSTKSALVGQADIAVGNVVGSNIFNVLFILGVSALIVPLVVAQKLLRLDVPLMIGLSVLTLVFAYDGQFSRLDGVILLLGLVVYVAFLIYASRQESAAERQEDANALVDSAAGGFGWLKNMALVVVGLVLLVLGSRWFVDSAVAFAQYMGISEMVIGLTIVAAGTSLPEVVTSIIAALRGERDIAVGNVVGSNIFNIMGVLGLASLMAPACIEISAAVMHFDIPVMIVVAFACLPIFFTGGAISRGEGAVLLAYYVAYTAYLVLSASRHDALPIVSTALMYFAIPLTALTLAIIVWREWRGRG
ncbi:calcium/sodium antiporter [Aidingimonas lacisalsi]|uniref:calcium/sodium antiporter n=1 Tax=Aidingimonas lacisalsi TaxID=2604086 RepID=UPI0011D29760|nr:calcium/sodium antiporter [Aidingimonas lacisalsi]